ncbi:hypothetical protein TNCV_782651 [Trichonephila clavipes]|nr:hypothetical protein TNCV_782651 [Trichonephila clavipes]
MWGFPKSGNLRPTRWSLISFPTPPSGRRLLVSAPWRARQLLCKCPSRPQVQHLRVFFPSALWFSKESVDQALIETENKLTATTQSGLTEKARAVAPARISSQSSHHCLRSPLPNASPLIQKDFGCVAGVQQTKQLPHFAKVDLV